MRAVPLAAFLVAFLLAAPTAARHDHDAHAAHPPAAHVAAPGTSASTVRFTADEPLHRHMQGIRQATDALGHLEQGHLAPEQVTVLADTISGHVRGIIAECALPRDADAALHAIIAPMMQSAQSLATDPRDATPVAGLRGALAEYARRFDDPPGAGG